MLATLVGVVFVARASAAKLGIAMSLSFPLHTMMIGVVGTLLMISVSFVLQLFSHDSA